MANPRPIPPIQYRFKPGVSGNPGGRAKLSDELRAIKELTTEEVRRVFAKYARMTKTEIQTAIQTADIPMFELAVSSILATAAKHGDYARLSFILDRTIGRVGKEGDSEPDEVAQMPNEELIRLVKDSLKDIEPI